MAGGISSYKKYNNAIDFAQPAEEYTEGSYIIGEIDSYLVKESATALGTSYSGQSELRMQFLTQYATYNIPLEDGRYIRVMVKNRGSVNKLESYTQGQGEAIPFKGIVYVSNDTDLEWYRGIKDFDMDALLSDVVIKEVDIEERVKLFSPGIALIILAILLFVYGDAIEIFHDQKEEEAD